MTGFFYCLTAAGPGAPLAGFAKIRHLSRRKFGTDSERLEQLAAINTALKNRGVKGRLVLVRDRLFLRGTFTDATRERKVRKISLDVSAANVFEAESRAVALAAIINNTGTLPASLPWDAPVQLNGRWNDCSLS